MYTPVEQNKMKGLQNEKKIHFLLHAFQISQSK